MPAAAVIPAPIAYIKVVAVKKLVVEFWGGYLKPGLPGWCVLASPPFLPVCYFLLLTEWGASSGSFTLKKLECLKQAY